MATFLKLPQNVVFGNYFLINLSFFFDWLILSLLNLTNPFYEVFLMFNLVYGVLRQPAFFILSIVYLALQYIGVFSVSYVIDLLLIGNFVWFFVENWKNPVFRRTLSHGTSVLSFMIIIFKCYGANFSTWTVCIAYFAFVVNLAFMVYSSKYNSENFIKASKIVLLFNRFKRLL